VSVKEHLRKGLVEVRFTKANGEIRTMLCTTMPNLIGIQSYSSKPPPEHLCVVWDIDADAWRSFKLDSVIEYKVLEKDVI
jgi:hypothetical protein